MKPKSDGRCEKPFDEALSRASDRRKESKARTKFGDGESDKQAIKETVELWRNGTGSAADKL